ncbi:hypothetical protein RRF57_000359 [Xylaria bambusicola]|uniref:Uncharacterized protein n=1 Tax=Xylaria bambusicola TaxID=326684 RepID=A0AAN7UEF4_9PEZI
MRLSTGISADRRQFSPRGELVTNSVRYGAAKDDQIKQRVSTETISTVNRNASGFTTSEQARNNLIVALLVNG